MIYVQEGSCGPSRSTAPPGSLAPHVQDVLVAHVLDRGTCRFGFGQVPGVDTVDVVRHVLDLDGEVRVEIVRHPLGHGPGRIADRRLGVPHRRDERGQAPGSRWTDPRGPAAKLLERRVEVLASTPLGDLAHRAMDRVVEQRGDGPGSGELVRRTVGRRVESTDHFLGGLPRAHVDGRTVERETDPDQRPGGWRCLHARRGCDSSVALALVDGVGDVRPGLGRLRHVWPCAEESLDHGLSRPALECFGRSHRKCATSLAPASTIGVAEDPETAAWTRLGCKCFNRGSAFRELSFYGSKLGSEIKQWAAFSGGSPKPL